MVLVWYAGLARPPAQLLAKLVRLPPVIAPEDSAGAAGTQRTLALNPILCISLAEISASNICLAM